MTATETELSGFLQSPASDSVHDRCRQLESIFTYLLVGEPYLFGREAYASELTLHFGTERGYGHPKLKGKTRGTHVLSLRASAWLLKSGTRPAFIGSGAVPDPSMVQTGTAGKPISKAVLESGAFLAPCARVTEVQCFPVLKEDLREAFGVRLRFTDSSVVLVFPTPEVDTDVPRIADVELLTPSGKLRVGPGIDWQFDPITSKIAA